MIAQDHHVLVAEILDQARAFVVVERDAFVVVIGEVVVDEHRVLAHRQQALLLARDGDAVGGVDVDHGMRVLARHVDARSGS